MAVAHPRLLVLVGIPGSGKSTYAAHLQAHDPALRIVSPDEIREQFYPGYLRGTVHIRDVDDHRVFRLAYRMVAEALSRGEHVLFDATSLTVTRRRKLITIAHRHEATVTARYFPIDLDEALRRNNRRERRVPTGAILQMARVLTPPSCDEGFDRITIHHNKNTPPGNPDGVSNVLSE